MDLQLAKALALQICERTSPCTVDELSRDCRIFPATPQEIRRLCELPDGPLRLVDDVCVFVTENFPISVLRGFFRTLLEQNLSLQNGETKRRHTLGPPARSSGKDAREAIGQKFEALPGTRGAISGLSKIADAPGEREAGVQQFVFQINGPTDEIPGEEDGFATGGMEKGNGEDDGARELETGAEQAFPAEAAAASPAIEAAPVSPLIGQQVKVIPKQKSRESRAVPRFEDFAVEGEVGAGGYGTVYKVRRHADGRVFAIKCPLENTHDSCVRNEVNMLKRLRGKNCIIRFEREVLGKIPAKAEAGCDTETHCPSILLEFVEHDKPEVLKREVTIEDLRRYSFCLFTALAELHAEKILHLDVKPGNFLFSRSNMKGYLVDFNLARVESAHGPNGKRPRRASIHSKADNPTQAKPSDRTKISRKRPFVSEEPTAQLRLTPSKRCRKIIDLANNSRMRHLGAPSCNALRAEGRPAATDLRAVSSDFQQLPQSRSNSAKGAKSKSLTSEGRHGQQGDAGNGHQRAETCTATTRLSPMGQFSVPRGGHRILTYAQKKALIPAIPSPQKRVVSPAVTAKLKRSGAEGPPELLGLMPQVSNASRVKAAALKPKGAPCHVLKDGPCVGTKGYRAPEVLMRAVRQTTKVDMWSAGVSLLQMVTGRSPFHSTTTEGALREIAELRGSAKMDALARLLGQSRRFSKVPRLPPHSSCLEVFDGKPIKVWSEKNSKRPDLHGAVPSSLYDLIERCLEVNPDSRITAQEALGHQFLVADQPLPPMQMTFHASTQALDAVHAI